MKRVVIIFGVLIVGFSAALAIKVRQSKQAALQPPGGSGVVEGTQVDLASRFLTRILTIHADEGDAVTAGQVLVRFDCREQAALKDAAHAQLAVAEERAKAASAEVQAALGATRAAQAQVGAATAQKQALAANQGVTTRQVDRIRRLQGEGVATETELDRVSSQAEQLTEQLRALEAQGQAAQGQAEVARNRAEAAQAQARAALVAIQAAQADVTRIEAILEDCALVAPISGSVRVRAFEPGELVLPGSRVLVLVRLDQVEATFYLPNAELGKVQAGASVQVTADAWPNETFVGKVASVAAEAEFTPRNVQTREDRDRLVYAVRVVLSNPNRKLRPGMPVDVVVLP